MIPVPCPVSHPPSSQTWGWLWGPWSLCVWSPRELSSSRLLTPSLSAGQAFWTCPQGLVPSASARGSKALWHKMYKMYFNTKKILLFYIGVQRIKGHLHLCCVCPLCIHSHISPHPQYRFLREAACIGPERTDVYNMLVTYVCLSHVQKQVFGGLESSLVALSWTFQRTAKGATSLPNSALSPPPSLASPSPSPHRLSWGAASDRTQGGISHKKLDEEIAKTRIYVTVHKYMHAYKLSQ